MRKNRPLEVEAGGRSRLQKQAAARAICFDFL